MNMAIDDATTEVPFFIVSSGRSGTTLLSVILNATGDVIVPPESDFIARAFPFFHDQREFDKNDYLDLAISFIRTSQAKTWGLSTEDLHQAFLEKRPVSFREVNETIIDLYLKRRDIKVRRWGIKRPVLIASIERIRSVFPEAKIIHLVRDGRDVYLSYQNVHRTGKKFGPKRLISSALYWVDGLRRLRSLQSDVLIEIRYEDLLSDPGETLKNLCDFLGLEYDLEKLLKYNQDKQSTEIISDEHGASIHSKIKNGLDPKNIQKYKKDMSAWKNFFFELLSAPYLEQYNYAIHFRVTRSILWGIIRQPLYFCARFFNDIRYSLRDRLIYQKVKKVRNATS